METPEMKNLPEWFIEHPVTKTIFAKHEDDTREKRKLAREALDRIKHDQEKTMPGLYEAISRAEEALAEAKKNVIEKEKALTWATHKKLQASIEASAAIQAQESILWETAPPVINETIKYFQDRLDALRRDGIKQQEYPGKKNLYTEKREPFSYSNIKAINACMEYLRAGIEEMEGFKLQLIPDQELKDRLDKLKRNIPGIDETKLYERNK
jgi:hypothetical protein